MGIGLLKPETSASQDQKSKHCKPHVDDRQICETTETGNFDCNICLESTQDPVVTLCGHLFCWSCLYRWLELHSSSKECPVCKAHVDEKTVIPLYGRGKTSLSDPRKKPALGITIPTRPQGFRGEHSPRVATGLHSHGTSPRIYQGSPPGGGHVAFSPGFGLFPSLLGLQMTGVPYGQYGFSGSHLPYSRHGFSGTPHSTPIGTQGNTFHTHRFYQQQEAFLYWLFILLACFAMACLLFF